MYFLTCHQIFFSEPGKSCSLNHQIKEVSYTRLNYSSQKIKSGCKKQLLFQLTEMHIVKFQMVFILKTSQNCRAKLCMKKIRNIILGSC